MRQQSWRAWARLQQLSISWRLSLGFGLVLALMLFMTGVALATMIGMQRRVDSIMRDQYSKVEMATEVKYNVAVIHQLLRSAIIAAEYQGENAVARQIRTIRQSNGVLLKRVESAQDSTEDKARYARIVQAAASDAASTEDLIKLLNAGDIGEAKSLMNSSIRLSEQDFVAALADMVAQQSAKMKQQAQLSADSSDAARVELAVLALLAMLLAIATAGVLVGGLRRQLGCEPTEACAIAGRIAAGDLASPITLHGGDVDSMKAALAHMSSQLASVVGRVRSGAEQMAAASCQIAAGNQDLSARTEQQASALEETAASIEQLTATVANSAEHARQANALAGSASAVAARGGLVVQKVVATMAEIERSSNQITDIIGVIDGIAFQTNILALNAAVEAARAGEQGRGFAVVATEVRNLAQRSAAAAHQIKDLIGASVTQVRTGAMLVGEAGRTMDEVVGSVNRVTTIIGEILLASVEQTDGIGQVNRAIVEIDDVTQHNAALVEEAAASAVTLQDQAAELARAVGVFRLPQPAAPTRSPARSMRPAGRILPA